MHFDEKCMNLSERIGKNATTFCVVEMKHLLYNIVIAVKKQKNKKEEVILT